MPGATWEPVEKFSAPVAASGAEVVRKPHGPSSDAKLTQSIDDPLLRLFVDAGSDAGPTYVACAQQVVARGRIGAISEPNAGVTDVLRPRAGPAYRRPSAATRVVASRLPRAETALDRPPHGLSCDVGRNRQAARRSSRDERRESSSPEKEAAAGTRGLVCAIGPGILPLPERHAAESRASVRTDQLCDRRGLLAACARDHCASGMRSDWSVLAE